MSEDVVIVTTLSHFKLRYAIPATEFNKLYPEPVDTSKLMEDVTSGMFNEFSQTHLGEVLGNVATYTMDDAITLHDAELDYLSGWSRERKEARILNWKADDY